MISVMIAAAGVEPMTAAGAGSLDEVIFIGGCVAVGLVLLFVAGRLASRCGHARHTVRYTVTRL